MPRIAEKFDELSRERSAFNVFLEQVNGIQKLHRIPGITGYIGPT